MTTLRTHLVTDELDSIARALAAKFTAVSTDELREVVNDAYREIAEKARITTHLIPLTLNRARRILASRTADKHLSAV